MTDFRTVHDSRTERPEPIDTTSSESTVYERQNIRQETRTEEMGGEASEITEWVYEQREWARAEYEATISPVTQAIMQAISDMELNITSIVIDGAV